jgi:tight adherence protein C
MVLILTFGAFLIATGVVLTGYRMLTAESPVEQRLRAVVPDGVVVRPAAAPQREGLGPIGRVLSLIGRIGMGGNEGALRQRLSTAGLQSTNAFYLFVGVRTLLSFGPALLYLIPQVSAGEPLGKSLLIAVGLWFVGHLLCTYWLLVQARRRIRLIQHALPDSLDLMVVCLEAGLGLTATIARVGEERSSMSDPLGIEFARVARELQEGRPRDEALRALADRNGVDDLKSLVGLIVQTDKLGASMAKTLRAHADVLRTKRRQRAEEAARKLPIKILFPLAFFILPSLFTVAIGPAILRIMDLVELMGRN